MSRAVRARVGFHFRKTVPVLVRSLEGHLGGEDYRGQTKKSLAAMGWAD